MMKLIDFIKTNDDLTSCEVIQIGKVSFDILRRTYLNIFQKVYSKLVNRNL